MSLNIPLHFKSFSLLSGKLYTTDYQSFIGMVYQNTPPIYPMPPIVQRFTTSSLSLQGRRNPVSYQYGQG